MTFQHRSRITFQRRIFPDSARVTKSLCEIRPTGGARLIMADPPWSFQDWSDVGDKRKSVAHQYPCMSLDWIQHLPVRDALAADHALLFLWATNPMLPQAIEAMQAWGFTYKTAGTWVKRTATGKLAFGGGRRFRSTNEPILIGTVGAPVKAEAVRSALITYASDYDEEIDEDDPLASLGFTVEAVRREHSRKSDEAYHMARAMVEGPAVELFSREARPGWRTWGNEVGKFSELVS